MAGLLPSFPYALIPPHLDLEYADAAEWEEISMDLDLAFVVDETGSMGSWIQSVKENILTIIHKIIHSGLVSSLRIAVIGFRDHPPQDSSFVTRQVPLLAVEESFQEINRFIRRMSANGGGDGPEALIPGLFDLVRLDWRPDASKVGVVITDAPPHGVGAGGDGFPRGDPSGETYVEQALSAHECGITLHTVTCGAGGVAKTVCAKIAEIGGGVCVENGRAQVLSDVIVSSARDCADQIRVRLGVVRLMEEERVREMIESSSTEEGRVEILLGECSEAAIRRTTFDKKTGQASDPRELTPTDLEEAIRSAMLKDTQSCWFAPLFAHVAAGSSSETPASGLVDEAKGLTVPLTKVDVDIHVRGGIGALVVMNQTFRNDIDQTLEAIYRFPLSRGACVNGFKIRVDEKTLVGTCVEKRPARETYDKAISEGRGAYRLREVSPQLFEVSVGLLQPGSTVIISIEYVAQLQTTNSIAVDKLSFPTHFGSRSNNVETEMKLTIHDSIPFRCPSHTALLIENDDEEEVTNEMIQMFELTDFEDEKLAKDIVLLFDRQEPNKPIVLVEELDPAMEKYAVSIDFIPVEETTTVLEDRVFHEPLILMLDTSTSMGIHREMLESALETFKGQVATCTCETNILTFSSKFALVHESEVTSTQLGDDYTLPEVFFGGSEIHRPLRAVLGDDTVLGERSVPERSLRDKFAGFIGALGRLFGKKSNVENVEEEEEQTTIMTPAVRKNVLLITDGHLTDNARIKKFLEQAKVGIRLFIIGVGDAINESFLDVMASMTGGYFTTCSTAESIEDAVITQLRRMTLSWTTVETSVECKTGIVTPGARSTMYFMVPNLDDPIRIHGQTVDGENVTMSFDVNCIDEDEDEEEGEEEGEGRKMIRDSRLVHTIAARHLIDSVEPDEEHRDFICQLAISYTLTSPFTSFVAVEEKPKVQTQKDPMEVVEMNAPAAEGAEEEVVSDDDDGPAPERALRASRRRALSTSRMECLSDSSGGSLSDCDLSDDEDEDFRGRRMHRRRHSGIMRVEGISSRVEDSCSSGSDVDSCSSDYSSSDSCTSDDDSDTDDDVPAVVMERKRRKRRGRKMVRPKKVARVRRSASACADSCDSGDSADEDALEHVFPGRDEEDDEPMPVIEDDSTSVAPGRIRASRVTKMQNSKTGLWSDPPFDLGVAANFLEQNPLTETDVEDAELRGQLWLTAIVVALLQKHGEGDFNLWGAIMKAIRGLKSARVFGKAMACAKSLVDDGLGD